METGGRRRGFSIFLASVLVCAWAGAAFAHKIHVFATADGAEISGSVYFSGGGEAAGVAVEVLGPEGAPLGRVTTDGDGEFTWRAAFRADHTFSAETPDGHGASYTVSAAELPDSLPPFAGGSSVSVEAAPVQEAASAAAASDGDLAARIELLGKQVREMRRQLDRFQERRSLQDILGGVGYIIGVAGVAFYLAARRESRGKRG